MILAANAVPIRFEGVAKKFGDVVALNPIDLDVYPGEFLTLLGPSGSGKTTLLNIAVGFLSTDAGRVLLGGRDITNVPPRQRNIGMVFQNYALFPHLDVYENVAYGLKVRKLPNAEIRTKVADALRMVQLEGYGARAIQQLSGGQQQRVALARAMIVEPDLLLMDEPLGALDRQLRKHVQLEIRRLHLAVPRTTIYVTHDQEEALVMSDRIAIMSEGRLEQIGTPQELYIAPANAFVARFLGESNLIPVTLRADDTLEIDGVPGRFSAPRHERRPAPGAALLLVRPEHLAPASDGDLAIEAAVLEVVYLGELTALRLGLANGQELWMRRMGTTAVAPGDRISIIWDDNHVRLLEREQSK